MMFFGNCLFCAVVLWLRYGGKIIMSYRPGTRVPHWMVVDRSGSLRHFRVVRNIMPWPMCYVIFLGRFESLGGNEQDEYIQPEVQLETD
jgi:hypothetical protein